MKKKTVRRNIDVVSKEEWKALVKAQELNRTQLLRSGMGTGTGTGTGDNFTFDDPIQTDTVTIRLLNYDFEVSANVSHTCEAVTNDKNEIVGAKFNSVSGTLSVMEPIYDDEVYHNKTVTCNFHKENDEFITNINGSTATLSCNATLTLTKTVEGVDGRPTTIDQDEQRVSFSVECHAYYNHIRGIHVDVSINCSAQ